ncbi:AAA family ATPase [Sporosarcina sp. resist]|uniref:ParA family protein n=1 Tax=Sporosarcina sp. resist TaxID=2762563 RepID=UPI00164CE678|nr:AAA family ATPase [Sporosarcina sp. resist]QNK86478.1 AAA family ATPase [Sporosarcina sp. resist]
MTNQAAIQEKEPAKVISFINMKGGVGKTTLCINIAYCLERAFSKKVLIIDMDPQFNASQSLFEKFKNYAYYLEKKKKKETIKYLFDQDISLVHGGNTPSSGFTVNPIEELTPNLHIIPGDLDMVRLESSERGTENLLKNYIQKVIKNVDYDYVLIDCPPTYSFYTTASLIASDLYFVPIKPDIYSALGIDLLRFVINRVETLHGASAKQLGAIFTVVENIPIVNKTIKDITDAEPEFNYLETRMSDFKYVPNGSISSFMYDMSTTRKEITSITTEFIQEVAKCPKTT